MGPFPSPPLPAFRVSPIKVTEKKEPGQYRFIHNLSYPYDEEAVNSSIPREKVSVKYHTIDDAVAHIKELGKEAYLAKTDIKSAFRIIPVHPTQHHLLGMSWKGQFYYDTTLSMGCSISCSIFERFSTAIQWVALNKLGIKCMVHVLDDFLIIAPLRTEAQQHLHVFLEFCTRTGIPIAQEKTEGPARSLTFLGILLDVPNSTMQLPQDKLEKCKQLIRQHQSKSTATLKELQSTLGHLNFACRALVPGRAFLRRACALTHKAAKPYHHIKITKEARADFDTWGKFLESYNGRSFFLFDEIGTTRALRLYTNSSGKLGFGAVFGKAWLHGTWPDEWLHFDISFLELYPIVLSAHLWGHRLSNRAVEFHTDNIALVSILNNSSSSKPHIMSLVRALVATMLKFNFIFRALHIPGVENEQADALSRQQIGRFKRLQPEANSFPVTIPQHLRPANSWLK